LNPELSTLNQGTPKCRLRTWIGWCGTTFHDFGFWRGFNGPFYGFDHVELACNHTDESHVGQHYALWMEEKGYADCRDYFLPNSPGQTVDRIGPKLGLVESTLECFTTDHGVFE
jgi:hypothetical protein